MTNPILEIDDYVKHVFREHNTEADHSANVGAEGQRKVVIDRKGNADTWKAVKGFWDGSCKDNGNSQITLSSLWSDLGSSVLVEALPSAFVP